MSIEQKIAALLEESAKLKLLEAEEVEAEEVEAEEVEAEEVEEVEAEEEFTLEDYTGEELEDFMMSEDFEQLDELSKAALGSYMRAAKDDRTSKKSVADEAGGYSKNALARQKAARATASYNKKSAKYHKDKGNYTSDPEDKIDHAITHAERVSARKAATKAALAHRDDVQSHANDKRVYDTFADRRTKGLTLAAKKILTKEEFDVQEDVDALLFGEDLSEEFKVKAATIFEAAVMARVNAEVATLEEAFESRLVEQAELDKEEIIEKVDGYLGYVVEQWMSDNEIAIENGLKSEIFEGFVKGLKTLFQEHYIEVPEERFDVVGDLQEQVDFLEAKLDDSLAQNVQMMKELNEMTRNSVTGEFCSDMTDTEVEKFTALAEELVYEDAENFASKLQIIKENYFGKKPLVHVESVVTDSPVHLNEETKHVDANVARYLETFNRIK